MKSKYEIDFDWLFYISKVHLNYTKEEFWESTHSEIYRMWKEHVRFNNWKLKGNNDKEENKTETKKKVNIEDLTFL